jgi:catechol 2,3-dioxygenase-like lactoylglutathione lyase family enzyme
MTETLVDDLTFRLHHTMLPVADIERSIGFYTRLLGMRRWGGAPTTRGKSRSGTSGTAIGIRNHRWS